MLSRHLRGVLTGLCLLCFPGLCAQGGQAIPAAVSPFLQAAPVTDVRKVENRVLTVGHSEFRFIEGDLVELQAGSKMVGYMFHGRGEFSYASLDPVEQQTFTRATQDFAGSGQQPGHIKDSFQQALIWVSGITIPDLPPTVPSTDGERWAKLLADFGGSFIWVGSHRVARVAGRPVWREWMITLAVDAANQPTVPGVRALLSGGKAGWGYEHDPAFEGVERLSILKSDSLSLLSKQPIGWSYKAPPAPASRLVHLDVKVEHLGGTRVQLEVEETLESLRPGQRTLALDLNNRREADDPSDMRMDKGWVEGLTVTDAQGRPIPHVHVSDVLLLEFPEPLPMGKPFRIKATYGGDLIELEEGSSYWQLGVWSWFPSPRSLGGHAYTVRATLTCPKPFIPVLPGTWLSRGEENGKHRLESRIDVPVAFFVMNAGKFDIYEDKRPERTIRVITYANETRNVKTLANFSHQVIAFYENFLGPFPFQALNIIQQLSYGWGQAPPGTLYITREALGNRSDGWVNYLFIKGINQRMAHELAHQYFGHWLKFGSVEDQWISEGFAEYCSALAMRVSKGKGESEYQDMVQKWRRAAEEAAPFSTIPGVRRGQLAAPLPWGRMYRQLTYDKSAYLVYDLHQKLGEQGFATLMYNFVRMHPWQFVGAQQLADLASAISKKDYQVYFDRYFWGYEMPDGKPAWPPEAVRPAPPAP